MSDPAALAPAEPDWTRYAGALRHRNFRLFYFGYGISLIGTWMQGAAMSWLVWRLMKSELYSGRLVFAGQIPNLLLAPFAGVLADRFSRQSMVVWTQALSMAQAFALAGLYFFSGASSPSLSAHASQILFLELMGCASLLGVINSFDMPVRQAFVVELVGPRDLPNAIAMNSFAFNSARVLGPVAAGLMLRVMSEGVIFVVNALSFLVVIAGLMMVRLAPRPPRPHAQAGMVENLREGLGFIRRHACVRDLLIYVGAISLCGLPVQVLMPAITAKVFGGEADKFGYLLTATGIGSLFGAAIMMRGTFGDRLESLIPAVGICYGVGLAVISFSRLFWLSFALLIPTGGCMMTMTLSANTYIQNHVPDRLRGRVMSFYTMMLLGVFPLGSLLIGWLGERIGTLNALRAAGVCCALAGAAFLTRVPAVRRSAERLLAE